MVATIEVDAGNLDKGWAKAMGFPFFFFSPGVHPTWIILYMGSSENKVPPNYDQLKRKIWGYPALFSDKAYIPSLFSDKPIEYTHQ